MGYAARLGRHRGRLHPGQFGCLQGDQNDRRQDHRWVRTIGNADPGSDLADRTDHDNHADRTDHDDHDNHALTSY